VLASLALPGCSSRTVPRVAAPMRPVRPVTLQEALDSYDGYCGGIRTVSASGDLDVKDLRAGKERKLGVRLVATRGDRLYLKGSVLVVTALEVVSDGQRFWFQVPSKKTVWTGLASESAPAAEGADQAPYYALRPRDVTAALLPDPLAGGAGETVLMDAEREAVWLSLASAEDGRGIVRRRVGLDRESLRPVSLRAYDEHGELVSDVELSGWQPDSPRRVVIRRPLDGYVADFSLDKVELNKAVPEKAFEPRPAAGYKTVEVGR
jgi:outer membrane lipoprotein-sorting protein